MMQSRSILNISAGLASLGGGLMLLLSSPASAQPVSLFQNDQAQQIAQRSAIAKELVGRWEFRRSDNNSTTTFILSSDGKFYASGYDVTYTKEKNIWIQYAYSLRGNDLLISPIDFVSGRDPKEISGASIHYQMLQSGELRVIHEGKSALVKKISSDATIPPNAKIAPMTVQSLVHQGRKAKQSEARVYVGTLIRSQRAFFLEHERFTTRFEDLGVSSMLSSSNYTYSVTNLSQDVVQITAVPMIDGLKAYAGFVFIEHNPSTKGKEANVLTLVCGSDRATQSNPPKPFISNNSVKCPIGYTNPPR